MSHLPPDLLPCLVALSQEAGRAIVAVYGAEEFKQRLKPDSTPVTGADLAADRVIQCGLARHWPGIPVVSEESDWRGDWTNIAETGYFLVDPLDGTREFIARNGEFTVNIAWVHEGVAQAGVVHAPALGQTFWGHLGGGAFRAGPGLSAAPLFVQPGSAARQPWRVLGSRSHISQATLDWLRSLRAEVKFIPAGSSLKFCRLAEGLADLYPRFGPTHHWDTAAGQAVLEAAGGSVFNAAGHSLRYPPDGEGTLNSYFVALAESPLWAQLPAFPPIAGS